MISTTPRSGQARRNHKRKQRQAFWDPTTKITIWSGDRAHWGTPYHTRVSDWLLANGIDPNIVEAQRLITASGMEIGYTAILLNDAGRPYADAGGRPVVEERTVPLVVPFGKAAAAGASRAEAARCCMCGSPDVVYRNYREQPFCWPCADGTSPQGRAAVAASVASLDGAAAGEGS